MTLNLCGLISGNLKRHLKSAHGIGQLIFDLFGNHLLEMIVPECFICERHRIALISECESRGVSMYIDIQERER